MLPKAERVTKNPQEGPRRQVKILHWMYRPTFRVQECSHCGLSDSINHRFITCRVATAAKVTLAAHGRSPHYPGNLLWYLRYTVPELLAHALCHRVFWHANSPRLSHNVK